VAVPPLFLAAMPLGPCHPLLRAQNDFRLALSDFDVAALYFALPFAVKPPPSFD